MTTETLYQRHKLGLLNKPTRNCERVRVFSAPIASNHRNYHVIDSSGCHIRLSQDDAAVVARMLDALVKKWR